LLEWFDRIGPAERIDFDLDVTDAGISDDTAFYVPIWAPTGDEERLLDVIERLSKADLIDAPHAEGLRRFAGARLSISVPRTMTIKVKLGGGRAKAKAYLSLLRLEAFDP
jgi:hypothetical protein